MSHIIWKDYDYPIGFRPKPDAKELAAIDKVCNELRQLARNYNPVLLFKRNTAMAKPAETTNSTIEAIRRIDNAPEMGAIDDDFEKDLEQALDLDTFEPEVEVPDFLKQTGDTPASPQIVQQPSRAYRPGQPDPIQLHLNRDVRSALDRNSPTRPLPENGASPIKHRFRPLTENEGKTVYSSEQSDTARVAMMRGGQTIAQRIEAMANNSTGDFLNNEIREVTLEIESRKTALANKQRERENAVLQQRELFAGFESTSRANIQALRLEIERLENQIETEGRANDARVAKIEETFLVDINNQKRMITAKERYLASMSQTEEAASDEAIAKIYEPTKAVIETPEPVIETGDAVKPVAPAVPAKEEEPSEDNK